MVILDLVVVNVALPTMQRDLRLSSADLQWVVITYGLTFGGFLLLGGRAADLLGRRNVLVAGLMTFTAGSLAAGLAGRWLERRWLERRVPGERGLRVTEAGARALPDAIGVDMRRLVEPADDFERAAASNRHRPHATSGKEPFDAHS
jgi:MFS family permease